MIGIDLRQEGRDGAAMLGDLPALTDADRTVGLTLSGERVNLSGDEPWRSPTANPSGSDIPEVRVTSLDFMSFVEGSLPSRHLTDQAPAWSARNVSAALGSIRRLLGSSPVPRPPALPAFPGVRGAGSSGQKSAS